jgi:hypothetical protein
MVDANYCYFYCTVAYYLLIHLFCGRGKYTAIKYIVEQSYCYYYVFWDEYIMMIIYNTCESIKQRDEAERTRVNRSIIIITSAYLLVYSAHQIIRGLHFKRTI